MSAPAALLQVLAEAESEQSPVDVLLSCGSVPDHGVPFLSLDGDAFGLCGYRPDPGGFGTFSIPDDATPRWFAVAALVGVAHADFRANGTVR